MSDTLETIRDGFAETILARNPGKVRCFGHDFRTDESVFFAAGIVGLPDSIGCDLYMHLTDRIPALDAEPDPRLGQIGPWWDTLPSEPPERVLYAVVFTGDIVRVHALLDFPENLRGNPIFRSPSRLEWHQVAVVGQAGIGDDRELVALFAGKLGLDIGKE